MEVILKFKLPDDKYDYMAAMNGENYQSALLEIEQFLRTATKHCVVEGYHKEPSEDQVDILDRVREVFYEILDSRSVHLEDIE